MPARFCPVGGGRFFIREGAPSRCPCHGYESEIEAVLDSRTATRSDFDPIADLARRSDRIKVTRGPHLLATLRDIPDDFARTLRDRFGLGEVTIRGSKNGRATGEIVTTIIEPSDTSASDTSASDASASDAEPPAA